MSRGNSVGYRQILSQLVEVKGIQSIVKKIAINILEGHTLLAEVGGEGRGGGSTVGGPKAATSTSSSKNSGSSKPQQEHKQRKAATSRRIRSSTNSTQQPRNSEGQEVWVPKVGGRLPVEFLSVVFETSSSGYKQNLQQLVIDFFGGLMGGQINCKIVLDILQKPPKFHTTAQTCTVGTGASNTTRRPPKRERERKRAKMGAAAGKKSEILGGPAEGGPAEEGPAEGESGAAPKFWAHPRKF